MKFVDHHAVLGLEHGATLAEIKAAFRRLAMELHPDRNRGDHQAGARLQEVMLAHKTLVSRHSEPPSNLPSEPMEQPEATERGPQPLETVVINCIGGDCRQRLRVPASLSGTVTCPTCRHSWPWRLGVGNPQQQTRPPQQYFEV